MTADKLDRVGYWTEIKLSILREYASAYARIMAKQSAIRSFGYIDGFAGAGSHISKASEEEIDGSPKIALGLGFSSYDFIDMDSSRVDRLKDIAKGCANCEVHMGDCNEILISKVLPKYRYADFRRALCLLDPYKLNPDWRVVETIGKMKSVEIFLNFMIMDANQNVLFRDSEKATPEQAERMSHFWGDESWRKVAYTESPGLFGSLFDKNTNDDIVEAYRKRLKEIAGFTYVPKPMPMRNSRGAVVYYLFFASPNKTGAGIVESIFNKYRDKGAV